MSADARKLPYALDPLIAEAKQRRRRRRALLATLAVVLALSLSYGVTRVDRGPGPTTPRSAAAAANAAAFRGTNWSAATLPGAICRGTRPIHLHHGSAVARLTRKSDGQWHAWPRIYLSTEEFHPTFGSLGGRSAAAIRVGCNNGGGTADGYMAHAEVIYVARPHEAPQLIGFVRPHVRPWGGNQLASLLSVAFRGDAVVAHEYFYGGSDGTCCASGRATTRWRFAHGRFTRIQTVITRRPKWLPGTRPRRH